MNRRTLVLSTAGLAGLLFLAGWFAVGRQAPPSVSVDGFAGSALVRSHSPVLGPDDAPVTVVEFFDLGVRQTPTFFVNGRPLLDFGVEQLIAMVRSQVEPDS